MNARQEMPEVKVGSTIVRVVRTETNEVTGKTVDRQIHQGIVVQSFGTFVRVFNDAPRDKGGDIEPDTSEIFPLNGRLLWCEVVGERKTPLRIPASLT